MAYSSSAAIQATIGQADLIALSDIDNVGTVDGSIVDAAIEEADRIIDSYAHKRYAVPFASTPSTLGTLSARMAVRIMRRNRRMQTAADVENEDTDRKWLEALSKGLVSIGVEPSPQASELVVDKAGERSETTKNVSRLRLRGFW